MNSSSLKILDLGCGKKKRIGSIGVDYSDRYNADVIHDLNKFPYPFPDNEFDKIYLDNVLEHLDDVIRVIEEVHRICKVGGKVKIIVPYFRSVWACIDPTHKHFFTVNSFSYFDPNHIICQRYDYSDARFSIDNVTFNESLNNRFVKRFFLKFANKYKNKYEYYLSHLVPLDDISYNLVKI